MESFDELKDHLKDWIHTEVQDAVKTAVAEGNKDVTAYLDERFGTVELDLNDVGGVVDSMAKDLGNVTDSVAKLATDLLAIPTTIAQQIEATLSKFNPFHLP